MKIYVKYSDGEYRLEPFTDGHAKAGLAGVYILDEEWREYQEYLDNSNGWHRFCRELSNEQYLKENNKPIDGKEGG